MKLITNITFITNHSKATHSSTTSAKDIQSETQSDSNFHNTGITSMDQDGSKYSEFVRNDNSYFIGGKLVHQHSWTQEEERKLLQFKGTMTWAELQQDMFPYLSVSQLKNEYQFLL